MNLLGELLNNSLRLFATTGSGTYVGTGSEIVSAALQACGILAQESILINLRRWFEHVGALIFVVGLMGAIISVALYGQYKRALGLLVCPALFFALLNAKEQARPTGLRFGRQEERNVADPVIQQLARNARNGAIRTADVSWLFARFDGVVNNAVQGLVSLLVDQANNRHLIIKSREALFARLLMFAPNDPQFLKLLAWSLDGECARLSQDVQRAAYTRIANVDGLQAAGGPMAPSAAPEVAELRRLRERYNNAQFGIPNDLLEWLIRQGVQGVTQPTPGNPTTTVNCSAVWRWTFNYTERLAVANAQDLANARANPARPMLGGNELQSNRIPWEQVHNEVLRLLVRSRYANNGGYAAQYIGGAGIPDTGPDEMGRVAPEDRDLALRILSAFWLRNTWLTSPHSNMTDEIFNRMGMRRDYNSGLFDTYANRDSHGGFMRIMYFASAIPYFQGLLQFLLTAAFPFFLLALLIPSKASAMFVWMALWVWVKSWDVGFALVLVARKIIFEFVTPGYGATVLRDGQPESAFAVALASDPLANLNTYYTIIGFLYCSIPVLTAHFCFGATNLFEAFKFNIDHNANRFAQRRSKESLRYAASTAQMRAERAKAEQYLGDLRRQMIDKGLIDGNASFEQFASSVYSNGNVDSLLQTGAGRDAGVQAAEARRMIADAKGRMFEWTFGEENKRNQGMVAMLSGRRSFGGLNSGIGLIEGAVDRHNQQYTRQFERDRQNTDENASQLAGNTMSSIDLNAFLDPDQEGVE